MNDHEVESRIVTGNVQLNLVDDLCEKIFGWMTMCQYLTRESIVELRDHGYDGERT